MKIFNLLILPSILLLTACQQLPIEQRVDVPVVIIDTDIDSDGDGVLDSKDKCPNTPLNVVIEENGCPSIGNEEPPAYGVLDFFYKNNETFPDEKYTPEILKVVEKMTEYKKARINIEGHASKAEKKPEIISHERAEILAQILKETYGINENRISINSYGIDRPIANNRTQKGQKMNQRAYISIY